MPQQEEGWPLGLQPLNVRVGLPRNGDFSGSISFNTLHTASPTSSTDSSSDLDTASTGSFFHDRSITLGSLIGASSSSKILKSSRVRKVEAVKEKKSKTWIFSLCPRETTDAENGNNINVNVNNNPPSLGDFLAVERRAAANECRRDVHVDVDSPNDIYEGVMMESNSLFVNGQVAPPRNSQCDERGSEHGGAPVLFSCMCGHLS
ncbi:uncharacterized protein At3g17950-like [Euphorbia lathyris]|uniref:uncharacterized protein At3g17950-like n=1 Tax=Euphorbia lathyris TaxID=212925 RepID=UPI003313D0C8